MTISRPFRRTCREFEDGSYSEGGRWRYLLHPKFANEPRHYVRAFLSLQADLMTLLDFIEPADANLVVYSHKVQQLLVRTCVEVEANLTAILRENGYGGKGDHFTMEDYRLVNHSHRLSSYEVRVPSWRGARNVWRPFAAWQTKGSTLPWYRAYNKAKHDRHEFFELATFEALINAMCGLTVVLTSQFFNEEYASTSKSLSISANYSYDTADGMASAIGGFFRVKYPTDWPQSDRYQFDWQVLEKLDDPFDNFDHAAFKPAKTS